MSKEQTPESARDAIDGVRVTALKAGEGGSVQQISSNVQLPEDEFKSLYGAGETGKLIVPPYNPYALQKLTIENNTLGQCIAAMEVNIDGTGYVIEHKDPESNSEDDDVADGIDDFFREPFPGLTFTSMRRDLRRDLEGIGYGFFEILRNPAGELMAMKPVPGATIRLVRLGDPVPVKKTIRRKGKDITLTVMVRERIFAQKIGLGKAASSAGSLRYFKEYGASRDLDKDTGNWSTQGQRLPFKQRASELLYFTNQPDVSTPYGLPRWITQAPSVVGSRKAEELNLEFFDSGGVPPIMIFLAGGAMGNTARTQLENIFNGKAADKNRGAIVEVTPTGGSTEKEATASVKIERFGSEKQKDSMFEKYDERCEQRVRASFRIPPLFVGKAEDFSFATAYVSYTVTEAQVFQPERTEFDEQINGTIMKELDPSGNYVFRSLPLTIKDVTNQLKALEVATNNKVLSGEDVIIACNEITGTVFKYTAPKEVNEEGVGGLKKENPKEGPETGTEPTDTPVEGPTRKTETFGVIDLVTDFMTLAGIGTDKTPSESFVRATKQAIDELSVGDRALFDNLLAARLVTHAHKDLEGSSDLCGCAAEMILSHGG